MIMNFTMRKCISMLNDEPVKIDEKELHELFHPEFVEWDGCVLLKLFGKQDSGEEKFMPNNVIVDRTQLEATTNHIHIVDIFPDLEENADMSLKISLRLIEVWGKTLKELFPNKKFHLVLSHDEYGSIVRFYCLRKNEVPWINLENIENFKNESILVKIV